MYEISAIDLSKLFQINKNKFATNGDTKLNSLLLPLI